MLICLFRNLSVIIPRYVQLSSPSYVRRLDICPMSLHISYAVCPMPPLSEARMTTRIIYFQPEDSAAESPSEDSLVSIMLSGFRINGSSYPTTISSDISNLQRLYLAVPIR
jgi:hypothetical protein